MVIQSKIGASYERGSEVKYEHTAVAEYRTGITSADSSPPAENVNCLHSLEAWFYIHKVSGTVDRVGVQALFYDSKEAVYTYGASRETATLPSAFIVDVKGHQKVALMVTKLEGSSPNIKINYDEVQEV